MIDFQELIRREKPKLLACIHCGFCLDACPTYQLSGDENNSPRGRLAIWRALGEGRMQANGLADFYLDECIGCLACTSACPANVPYAELFDHAREEGVRHGMPLDWRVRLIAKLLPHPATFQFLNAPLRLLRRAGILPSRFIFPGSPKLWQSTAAYARELMKRHRPTGPKVALFTGCLMEAGFREINFATVRVLIANDVQVVVPESQTCCGAVHEHAGLTGKADLDRRNRKAFDECDAEIVLTNSAGCGLALRNGINKRSEDIISFLNKLDLKPGRPLKGKPLKGKPIKSEHLFFDMPCHLYHGQKVQKPPVKLFEAIGNSWSLAPDADRCCGSGGTYMITHPENSTQIIREKSAFLNAVPFEHCTLVTANHVCMMQWHSAIASGMVKRKVEVKHLVQVLDEAYGSGNA